MVFISKFLTPKGFVGITLYPFIFLKQESLKENKVLINHEKIHLKQQVELLIILFYILYVTEWLLKLVKYRDKKIAYRNLSFEREAYQNEEDLLYLEKRKRWAFVKYL